MATHGGGEYSSTQAASTKCKAQDICKHLTVLEKGSEPKVLEDMVYIASEI